MALQANSKVATEAASVTINTNYAGAANDPARVQLLIDLVSAETADGTNQIERGYLDEMSPMARVYLVAHLTKLKAATA
jgi:hypothetical protein